jgi:hypothetical protein
MRSISCLALREAAALEVLFALNFFIALIAICSYTHTVPLPTGALNMPDQLHREAEHEEATPDVADAPLGGHEAGRVASPPAGGVDGHNTKETKHLDVVNKGSFQVSLLNEDDPRDLAFQPVAEPTPEEIQLRAEIQGALTILRCLFPKVNKRELEKRALNEYVRKLYTIALTGLERISVPEAAAEELASFKDAVLLQEGPRVKNTYMGRLGARAAILAVAGLVLYFGVRAAAPHLSLDLLPTIVAGPPFITPDGTQSPGTQVVRDYSNFLLLWSAAMVGSWLSFGIRRVDMTFEDLARPEVDMVKPIFRLVFTGILALTLGLVFVTGMAQVSVGTLNTNDLTNAPLTAMLIGLFCGIGEQALTTTVGRRATQFVGEIGK